MILKSKTVKKEIHRLSVVESLYIARRLRTVKPEYYIPRYFVSPFIVHGPSAARRPSKISGYSAITREFRVFSLFLYTFFPPLNPPAVVLV